MTYEVKRGPQADRRLVQQAIEEGYPGWTTDEHELFIGSTDTPFGRAVTPHQAPRYGLDSRRLWVAAAMGREANTWTDVAAATQDSSGIVLSPKPYGSPGTDVVATGVIGPYELADGGEVVITACGTYTCGSLTPRILARLKIDSAYVAPQYEVMNPNSGPSTPTDVASTVANAFEWSSITLGLNALAGYEALWLAAANLTRGEFQWRLTMRLHSLGRYAKWQRGDDDSSTKDRNVWVEATLEWGGLQYNGGGRMGEALGYYNTTAQQSIQYHAFMPNTRRGSVYSFLGQQWLCHAGNSKTALNATPDPDEIDQTVWVNMLAEDAPGIGAHWKEQFVPIVSRATFSGFATMDHTVTNQIQLELGGPQQVDLGTTFAAYSGTTGYQAEGGTCSAAGVNYVAKCQMYASNYPRFTDGVSDVTGATPSFTAAPTGASPLSERCWRALPTSLRDEMRMQVTQAYLFGRRNGVTERRV